MVPSPEQRRLRRTRGVAPARRGALRLGRFTVAGGTGELVRGSLSSFLLFVRWWLCLVWWCMNVVVVGMGLGVVGRVSPEWRGGMMRR
ncbi:extensin-like [Iris pallida]|uniref:Extensin-like n=1 Tax=Iris pallida TaxID=29817 RepID=A0AAX6G3M6_IRIPA|nr:extensin-like [Iris pallida]KAJ6822928.1 extensin-like [Iris pallida]